MSNKLNILHKIKLNQMKKLLFIFALSCVINSAIAQQPVYDAQHQLKGYIDKDGTVSDKNKNALCIIRLDQGVTDTKGNTMYYIIDEHEIQDKNHKTVAFMLRDGTVQDAQHNIIGHVSQKLTGPVVNGTGDVVGYVDQTEPLRTAMFFFVLKY